MITTAGKNGAVARILGTVGASTPAAFNWVGVGTGTTDPAAGDTALQTEIGTRVQDASADAGATGVAILIASFAAGNATGTLTEVGVFNDSSGGTLLSRTEFSPVAKGASDTLQVTITFTLS